MVGRCPICLSSARAAQTALARWLRFPGPPLRAPSVQSASLLRAPRTCAKKAAPGGPGRKRVRRRFKVCGSSCSPRPSLDARMHHFQFMRTRTRSDASEQEQVGCCLRSSSLSVRLWARRTRSRERRPLLQTRVLQQRLAGPTQLQQRSWRRSERALERCARRAVQTTTSTAHPSPHAGGERGRPRRAFLAQAAAPQGRRRCARARFLWSCSALSISCCSKRC